jgi:1-acyl-sn-glycerol-3-phosphate acyltransferase
MLLLRSILFHLTFTFGTLGLLTIYYIRSWFDPIAGVKGYHAWGKFTAAALKICANVNISIRGAEHIPTGGGLIACKHQSTMETAIIFAVLKKPTVILKKELLYLPFASRLIRQAGLIPVDRGAGSKAIREITKQTSDRFKKGMQIVIFPEGTRTALNETKPYKRGVYSLYKNLNTECVPVALNSGIFWGKKDMLIRPGTAIFEFLPPIPAGQRDQEKFLSDLTVKIESATARLVYEGVAEQNAIRKNKALPERPIK